MMLIEEKKKKENDQSRSSKQSRKIDPVIRNGEWKEC